MDLSTLKGLSRWVTAPSLYGGVFASAFALVYGLTTVAIPPGTGGPLCALAAGVVAVCAFLGHRREQGGLRTVRALGAGTGSADHLREAVAELFRLPDRCFWTNGMFWTLGSTAVAAAFAALPGVEGGTAARLAFVGAAFGPLSAMLVYLGVTLRSREAIRRVAAVGLSARDVIEAAPPSRLQLRRRLVTFIAISVLTPTALIADLARSQLARDIAALLGEAPAVSATRAQLATFGVVAAVLLLVLVTSALAGKALRDPMRETTFEAARTAEGDLRELKVVPAEDELWWVSASFTLMRSQLLDAIVELQKAGRQIATNTEQLVATSRLHESGSNEQAASLNETSATTEELARSAAHIAQNAGSVADLAQRTLSAAQEGQRSADAFFAAMVQMRAQNQAIADAVVKLNKRVQQIGKVVEFINGIADKSDLLAVNAELEGTKAGEVGQGFSLVAGEMRRLAESVLRSTREISTLIGDIRDATHAAVMATEAGVKATELGSSSASEVSLSLQQILGLARETSDAVRTISLATQQQQNGTDQLADAMVRLLIVTQQGTQATKQITGANDDLSSLAKELSTMVERFTVS